MRRAIAFAGLIGLVVAGCGAGTNAGASGPDAPGCGNGVVEPGEGCDDGERNDDRRADACRTNCVPAGCGDGVRDAGESCDDGSRNGEAPDACRADCSPARCGDGTVDTGEACDDGVDNSDRAPDACRLDCRAARCGDEVIDTGESCDDGARNSDTAPNACRTDCLRPVCGDGVTDAGEGCDDGPGNGDTTPDACRSTCRPAGCGDRVIDTGEGCDDGNDDPGDGCDRCTPADLAPGRVCRTDGSLGHCGAPGREVVCRDPDWDGTGTCAIVLEPGEACVRDAADAICGPMTFCWHDADPAFRCIPSCGNGSFQPEAGEQCDDGNSEPNDNCSNDCQVIAGTCAAPVDLVSEWVETRGAYVWGGTLRDHPSQTTASCLAGTEWTPDVIVRFTAPAAGTWVFRYEPLGWEGALTLLGHDCQASESPWSCVAGMNGVQSDRELAAGETVYLALDGSISNTFDLLVWRPACGDGVQQPMEECDDGNVADGDNCSATCEAEGKTCEAPWNLQDGSHWLGHLTPGMGPGVAASCVDGSGSWPEAVGRLVAPADGRYLFTVRLVNSDGPAAFSIRGESCGAQGIERLCGTIQPGVVNRFLLDLTEGETVFPIVGSPDSGSFILEVHRL